MKKMSKLRQEKGMTKSDLAFELRIQPAQLSKVENGRMFPYKPTQEKLEDFFGIPIEELLKEV